MPAPDELPPEGMTVVITGPDGEGEGYYRDGKWWRAQDGEDQPDAVVWSWQPLGEP